jgi:dTMP kinase
MVSHSLFIVIEGLDGSGKTTATRHLGELLEERLPGKILRTFEPNDDSCAGEYIRQVLRKEITTFNPRTLALAFAANRLDHCDRLISPWLDGEAGRIVICDRYYLSSLVYQSSEGFLFSNVMQLNELARKPDLIFFLNVSNEVCRERLDRRNQPLELFEENLTQTRQKYRDAIAFLKKHRQEEVIEIQGGDTPDETVSRIMPFISPLLL